VEVFAAAGVEVCFQDEKAVPDDEHAVDVDLFGLDEIEGLCELRGTEALGFRSRGAPTIRRPVFLDALCGCACGRQSQQRSNCDGKQFDFHGVLQQLLVQLSMGATPAGNEVILMRIRGLVNLALRAWDPATCP
jgi:hypothetical protein